MKKAIAIFIVIALFLLTVLVAFSPLLPESSVFIASNIPLTPSDIFWKVGPVFFTYLPKMPVSMQYRLLKVEVSYTEPPKYAIKFNDVLFGLTKDGYIVQETEKNLKTITAKIESTQWNESFVGLFLAVDKDNLIDKIDSFCLFQNYVAFFDKNGILNIIGDEQYSKKLQEYLKTIELFSNKLKEIKQIDFRFDNQSVIIWR